MSEEREFLKRFADSKWNYDDWCFLKAVAKELLAQPERDFIREIQYLTDCLMVAEEKVSKLLIQPEQTEQTHVAWMYDYISPTSVKHTSVEFGKCPSEEWMTNIRPLYASPPTRKPLSDEWLEDNIGLIHRDVSFTDLVRAVEKAHGIGVDDE